MKTRLFVAALLSAASTCYASCGSTFCAVNTHWDTQGLVNDEKVRVDLRYSYAKADTPRVGSSKVAKPLPSDPNLIGAEVENQRTVNQAINLDADYRLNEQWNVMLGVPLVMRDHSHQIGDTVPANVTTEQKSFTKLGDLRVVANYRLASSEHHAGNGLRFGIKLPTGATDVEMVPGTTMEAGLQPGTGSTDVILGAYHHQDIENSTWGWFVSGQVQSAVALKNDYRPGDDVMLDAGGHYAISPTLTGLLQLNLHYKKADGGTGNNVASVNPHSGGRSLNLSPGLSVNLMQRTRLYGFVQLPLYQYANPDPNGNPYGQLTAPWSASIGISHSY